MKTTSIFRCACIHILTSNLSDNSLILRSACPSQLKNSQRNLSDALKRAKCVLCHSHIQYMCTYKPATLSSIYRRGKFKGKIKLRNQIGWHQVFIQVKKPLKTCKYNVHCCSAWPKPILQTLAYIKATLMHIIYDLCRTGFKSIRQSQFFQKLKKGMIQKILVLHP